MADVTRTDNLATSRTADIKRSKGVKSVKKVVRKRNRMTLRERPSDKNKKGGKSDKPKKDHIDVYA